MLLLRVNNFDALRLVLAFLVFLAHWNYLTSVSNDLFVFHLSGLAVDMFFVVSGFLIFWSFDSDSNFKRFYIKRFFRVYPLYAILIFLQAIFFVAFSDGGAIDVLRYIAVNLLFLNFLAPSVGSALTELQVNAINGSLWTLKNEVAFYVMVPFIYAAFKRFGLVVLAVLYTLSVLYMFVVDCLGFEKLIVQFPAQLRLFVAGVTLYVLFKKINARLIFFLVLSGLSGFLIVSDKSFWNFAMYPFWVASLVFFFAYLLSFVRVNFDFSYSLYILHFPLIQLSLYFGLNSKDPVYSFVILTIILLFLSYYSERYIEKPFVRYGRQLTKKVY